MNEVLIVASILLFIIFLKMGITSHIKRTNGKNFYYSLSIIFLIGAFLLLAFLAWEFGELEKREQTAVYKSQAMKNSY